MIVSVCNIVIVSIGMQYCDSIGMQYCDSIGMQYCDSIGMQYCDSIGPSTNVPIPTGAVLYLRLVLSHAKPFGCGLVERLVLQIRHLQKAAVDILFLRVRRSCKRGVEDRTVVVRPQFDFDARLTRSAGCFLGSSHTAHCQNKGTSFDPCFLILKFFK